MSKASPNPNNAEAASPVSPTDADEAAPPLRLKEVAPGSGVFYERFDNGIFLELPFPPSVNEKSEIKWRTNASGQRVPVIANTTAANGYLSYWPAVAAAARLMRLDPIAVYCPVRFTFFMTNPNYDTHNGLKLLCDLLQHGRVFENDRYILVQTERPLFVKENPRVRVELSLYDVDPTIDANLPPDAVVNPQISPTEAPPPGHVRIWDGTKLVVVRRKK